VADFLDKYVDRSVEICYRNTLNSFFEEY